MANSPASSIFIRSWLTHTPPLPDTALPAAQAKGRDRFDGFVEALGRRLARATTFAEAVAIHLQSAPSTIDSAESE
jgi:hypothetical protein